MLDFLRRTFKPVYRSLYFPPAVIFVAVVAATIFGWQSANDSLRQDIAMAASSRADAAEQSLREHMVSYEQVLHGSAGLLQSSEEVTLKEWERFLSVFNIRHFAGVQGVGLIKVFGNQELPSVTDFMAKQGVARYKVTPTEPDRNEYAAILYPHTAEAGSSPLYGFDAYSEPVRRQTMLRARDTGGIAITPRIDLLPTVKGERHHGFSMYVPYYNSNLPARNQKERRSALEGYVYAAFRSDRFFENIMSEADNKNSGFYVTSRSGDSTVAMYESPMYKNINRRPHVTQITKQINLHGQVWSIRFVSDANALVSDEQLGRPGAVLFFGIFSAVLIAVIILLLIRARVLDFSTEKEQAVELAKDELLSLASHQLRTPATGVKQYVGMVLQGFSGRISASQRSLLEKAYASNDRQLRIINEILHLAKIGSGRIVLAKQPTNLNELVGDIVNEQMPDIKAANHKIKVDLPDQPLTVYADTHMLRMALENLLSNAIKYTHKGGHIDVKVYKTPGRAHIKVTDTGIGIRPEDLETVFRQFSRLPNELSLKVGGTGIGLYLAKHLVELHKGKISVRSQPDEGSVFTISLPHYAERKDL